MQLLVLHVIRSKPVLSLPDQLGEGKLSLGKVCCALTAMHALETLTSDYMP